MKKLIKKFKKAKPFARCVYILLSLAYFFSFIFFTKSIISLTGIETKIRYFVLVSFLAYFFLYVYKGFTKICKKKYVLFSFLSIITFVFSIIFSGGAYAIDYFYGKISGVNERDKVLYTSYLITLKDTNLNNNHSIGMVNDSNDIEGNILAKKIIKNEKLKQNVKEYDGYTSLLVALYEKEVDGVFVSSNYVTLFSSDENFSSIGSDTKVVHKTSEEIANKDAELVSDKSLTEPFTVLIMGVDSETDGLNANAAFNGDTLMLATFNPKTLNVTLLSIPRDTYVPIACKRNRLAKINSSAAYGTSCVIDTIEQFMDIDIDYYVKINFKGVVDIVDAVGGVTVDVEKPDYATNHGHDCKGMVCEQNSDRLWGEHTIYIKPGVQKLDGEQALAYARCRGLYISSDLARNRHQQDIIMAIASELMNIGSYNEFKNILDAVINNMATNMSTSQILSSYNIFKEVIFNLLDKDEMINIQKGYLETYPLNVYLANSNRITQALGYYEDSRLAISNAMKDNLEVRKYTPVKTFTFDMNETYEQKVIGKGLRNEKSADVLPSYVGSNRTLAEKYCLSNNLDCLFKYVDSESEYFNSEYDADIIGSQVPHAGTLMKDIEKITFYINGEAVTNKSEE